MLGRYLLEHPWFTAVLWLVLYNSDYYLTLLGAKLQSAQNIEIIEGSYELTPEYQKDVDRRRIISFSQVLYSLAGSALLAVGVVSRDFRLPYAFLVGYMIIPEVAVHGRHIQSMLHYSRLGGNHPGQQGRIVRSRASIYRVSAVDLACEAGVVAFMAAVTGSVMLLGGVTAMAISALAHLEYSKKGADLARQPEEGEPEKVEN